MVSVSTRELRSLSAGRRSTPPLARSPRNSSRALSPPYVPPATRAFAQILKAEGAPRASRCVNRQHGEIAFFEQHAHLDALGGIAVAQKRQIERSIRSAAKWTEVTSSCSRNSTFRKRRRYR